jgi:hypothetical protein
MDDNLVHISERLPLWDRRIVAFSESIVPERIIQHATASDGSVWFRVLNTDGEAQYDPGWYLEDLPPLPQP